MHAARGSNWKLVVLIIVLVLVIAILGFLCVRFFLNNGLPSRSNVTAGNELPTQVAVYDARGRDVTENIAVTASSLRPDTVDADTELTLMDITWAGRKDPSFPFIISVSDSAFPNNDGLSVYHFADGQWVLLGTYLIEDHTVSFQTESLSPFAFQVISSTPEPTATPEPTPTPEPTATPEPTPEPIDYGQYDRVQVGEFVQANSMVKDGIYVIAYVDDPDAEAALAAEGEVTFFDVAEASDPLPAKLLINYDGTDLRVIDAEVVRGADGRYTITSTVVEGMLWTAVDSDTYMSAERFSLANNNKYLNLDEENENVVLDDDEVRTRWLYGAVVPEEGDSFTTMSYQIGEDTYFVQEMDMLDTVSGEGTDAGQEMSFTVSTESDTAKKLVIFRLSGVGTGGGNDDGNSSGLTGLYVLTGTPDAVQGIDATPAPTEAPEENQILIPTTGGNTSTGGETGGNSGTSTGGSTNTDPGTEVPVNTGGESSGGASPTDAGTSTGGESSGGESTGGESGGESGGNSGGEIDIDIDSSTDAR